MADISWFHFMRHVVLSGEFAKWSHAAKAVYIAVKALCDFHEGTSAITYKDIERYSGLTDKSVKTGIDELVRLGRIRVLRKGRAHHYEVLEKIPLDGLENEIKEAIWKYVPAAFAKASKEVIEAIRGDEKKSSYNFIQINIGTLNVGISLNGNEAQFEVTLTEEELEALEMIDKKTPFLEIAESKRKKRHRSPE